MLTVFAQNVSCSRVIPKLNLVVSLTQKMAYNFSHIIRFEQTVNADLKLCFEEVMTKLLFR